MTCAANTSTLPDPDPAALRRSGRVAERVRAALEAAGGWLTFGQYMRIVLYAPDDGYYAAGDRIFGRHGDYVTAPESGTLFARCLAAQCAEILGHAGWREVVEYGAGSGRLAADLVEALSAADTPPDRYAIVEPSAGLATLQRERLSGVPCVAWTDDHPAPARAGVIVANEVLDALPVERFVMRDGEPRSLGVGLGRDGFTWREGDPVGAAFPDREVLTGLPDGYTSEFCPGLVEWIAGLRRVLERGVALLVDYGYPRHEYYHPSRHDGTLKCHYRHFVHDDPFALPGLQDVTAAVDFTAVAEAASAAGFEVAGFASQTRFLLGCGLESALADAQAAAPGDPGPAAEARRLLLPTEMGQTCRAMALAIGYDGPLAGFADDERHRLSAFAAD